MSTGQLEIVLGHIHRLVGAPAVDDATDGQLLDQFAGRHDEAAFAALMRRHGSMVLGVCRRVLHHGHDAEDAFQATFLVLFRRARFLDRRRSLAGWLYTVAYHVALKARAGAQRRRRQERQVQEMPRSAAGDVWHDLQPVLDEELNRLPDRCREPFLLCYLEGKTNEEAARRLGCPVGTLKSRLAQARQLLRARLARRGISLSAGLLTTVVAAHASAAVPPLLLDATFKTTLALAAGKAAATAPALLAEGVLKAMFVTKLKLATALLVAVGILALTIGMMAQPSAAGPPAARTEPRPQPKSLPVTASAGPEKAPATDRKPMTLTGQVLDAEGKPVAAAEVAVVAWPHHHPHQGEPPPLPEVWAKAKADAEGHFELTATPRQHPTYYSNRVAQLAVLAGHSGHGVGWSYLKFGTEKAEATVRLHPEQVRKGQIFDLQGQPVAGLRIEVVRVGQPAPKNQHFTRSSEDERRDGEVGVKASDNETANQLWEEEVSFWEAPVGAPFWPTAVTTDKEGRFHIRGVGRNQTITVRTQGNEQAASERLTFSPKPDAQPKEDTFSAAAPCLIEGTITDAATGRPVARARVQVEASGSTLYLGQWPLPGDWKGRQQIAGQRTTPSSLPILAVPSVRALTDERGHFRLSPFRNWNDTPNEFTVVVAAPAGETYQTVRKQVKWPKGALKQEVAIPLPYGVLVRGQVVEAPASTPLSRARVDFWSKQLPVPSRDFGPVDDGTLYPAPCFADGEGRFEIIVPPGPCYLMVNGPTPVYLLQKIAAEDLGVTDGEEAPGGLFLPPGQRAGKKHHYYPDGLAAIDQKVGAQTEVTVTLRRAPILKGRVLGTDGRPALKVKLFHGQEPFKELSHGWGSHEYAVREGAFEIPIRNREAPLCLAFLDADNKSGASASFTSKQALDGPVTIRLAPCGSATARLIDAQKKPLAGYRALFWMSLPAEPYTSPAELERVGVQFSFYNYDAVWLSLGDPAHYADGPRTDNEGKIALPALIPGATYRLSLFGGKAKDFTVAAGKSVELGDLVIQDVDKTKKLPSGK